MSDLPQLPWDCPCRGLVLVVEFWAGIGGLAFAALSLGLRCIILAAEIDPAIREAKARFFPNLVEIEKVEHIHVDMLTKVLRRRQFSAILAGGGSPCQGNSSLNSHRRGLGDHRSRQPEVLQQFAASVRQAHPEVPFFCLLENVASSPPSVISHYSRLMGACPVEVDAAQWGYVRRRRLFWLSGPSGGADQVELQLPDGFEVLSKTDRVVINKVDGKPLPSVMRCESGFCLAFEPTEVAAGRAEPMHVFTREFEHPADRLHKAPFQAQLRFSFDKRRFPPSAYGDESLLWKGSVWRHPTPNEKAVIMGIPSSALQSLHPDKPPEERRAALNSVIGNGFHIPSVMLMLLILFQLTDKALACSPSPPWSCPSERRLLRLVPGSVFDDAYLRRSPFLQPNLVIVKDFFELFPGVSFPLDLQIGFAKALDKFDLAPLQAFWVYLKENGHTGTDAPPEWRAQRQRGLAAAAVGTQRAAGDSSAGVDHLLPPGLGRDEHLRQARGLLSPFRACLPLDLDLQFAIEALAVFGPRVSAWRGPRQRLLRRLLPALRPLQLHLDAHRVPTSRAVASDRNVALMAFLTVLLRWPDRDQPQRYLRGFNVMGNISETSVFRKIGSAPIEDLETQFFGTPAIEALDELLASKPPKDHKDIFDLTVEEQGKQYCSNFMSATAANKKFGVGKWRPIHRFLVHQADGKRRLIDDGRRGQQNQWAAMPETIFTIGVDFAPQVATALHRLLEFLDDGHDDKMDLEQLTFIIADLPDAFRGLPVAPADQRATVVAVFDGSANEWRFTTMFGCPFGLGSVVLHFNRFPALMVAAARRLFGLVHGAYFDDNLVIEPHYTAMDAKAAIMQLFDDVGTPPKPSKTMDAAGHRVFLGAAVSHIFEHDESFIVLAPREVTRAQVLSDLTTAINDEKLSAAMAAKIRGRSGWLASNSHGRVGRIGMSILKELQYGVRSGAHLTPLQLRALKFHLTVVCTVPPRLIPTKPAAERPPMVLYSDAEYTPGRTPRVGWVLFRDPPATPLGFSMLLPEVLTRRWEARRQQIFPAESVAIPLALAVLAPHLQGRDCLAFCDNAAAVSSLIRGTSRCTDVLEIAELCTALQLQLAMRLWIDWVDSGSNPADGLSRDGITDAWTCSQNWSLRELTGKQCPSLSEDPFFTAQLWVEHWSQQC